MKPLWIGRLKVEPPLLQAPMAGFTNYPFRMLIRRFGGVGLPVTEMISARGFIYKDQRQGNLPERIWGIADEPRPLAVQIWDNDPATLAEVGHRLAHEFRVSVVDINFGCPARDVSQKAESGSYLLGYPERIGEIVARVAAACNPVPVTAKIRLGLTRDSINAVDVVQAIEGAGGAAVTVHGRTADQMFRGNANWEEIAKLKSYLHAIPLIGNGDIKTQSDVVNAFNHYGVDGVMIGRAALGRPWLFAQAAAALRGDTIPVEPTKFQQRQILLEHYRLVCERFGVEKGTVLMRAYACWYGHGLPGARAFRRAISEASNPEEFTAAIDRVFGCNDSD